MAFVANSCPATLAPGASCSATGRLTATATGDASFQVTVGGATTPLTITVMPACPQTCGPSGDSNCCDSSVIPGNADGATRAGETYVRSRDPSAAAAISDFRLDRYEVTVGRFRAFVAAGMGTQAAAPAAGAGAHARIPGSGWDPAWNTSLPASTAALVATLECSTTYQTWTDAPGANESVPMNCITWWDAMAFCAWDGGYLPSEAEWDYAAAGGAEQRTYPWSNPPASSTIDCTYANYFIDDPESSYCVNGTTGAANRVGSESPRGDSRWGQTDMAGDLHEWVLDWYMSIYPVPCINCATLTTLSQRVVRGGSFTDVSGVLESGARSQTTPNNNSVGIGARCARTP
jgi:formylglycine-generating enzyme required for sulfatase activity